MRKTFGLFIPFARPHAALAAAGVLFALLGVAVNLFQAGILERIIDSALARDTGTLIRYVPYFAILLVVDLASAFFINFCYGSFSAHYLHDLRPAAVDRLQRLPAAVMEKRHSGDIMSRLSEDLSVVQSFMGSTFLDIFMQIIMLIAASSYMIFLDWKLLIVSILPVPVALIAVNAMTKNMYSYFRQAGDALGKANAAAQDALGGIATVKAYGLKAVLAQKYRVHVEESLRMDIKAAGIMRLTPPFNILLRTMPTVFCFGYGSYLIIRGELTPGALIAFNFLLGFVQWPLAFLPDLIVRVKRAMGAGTRVAELFEIELERKTGSDYSGYNSPEALSFEGVNFSYGEDKEVISDLSFSLAKGERIAVVGSSGCGKSTVLKLLCGDYETHSGTIKVQGYDTRDWNLDALRSHFSVISQDIFLFPASIHENIAYGRPGVTREEVIKAAKTANAHEFIMETNEGYDSQVGERGIKLSGGQKQRIALARALVKGSPILLLDEPTSALDTHSEALVQEAIDRSLESKTAIIVAHRLSTIKNADRILVMDKGKIAEQGKHEELLAAGGLYAELYSRQFNSAEDSTVEKYEAIEGENHE